MRLSLAEARECLLRSARPLPAEAVPLAEAAGRIIAETIVARVCLPPRDCATLDGYALRVADLVRSGGAGLPLGGTIHAGTVVPPPLPPGHCLAVTTGAPLPPGADAVLPWEAARRDGEAVAAATLPAGGSGIRRAGEETRPGDLLVPAGTPADPRTLERLAAQGIMRVPVPRRARVHIVATGDELVAPGEDPGPGQRVASNLPMLEAWVRSCGGQVIGSQVVADDPGFLRQALAAALVADVALTLGGTLRGSKDLTKGILADLGAAFLFDGLATRPGSSCAAATAGRAIVLCFPGSPGAACLAFAALGRPLLRGLHGWSWPLPAFAVRLGEPLEPAGEDTRLVLGVVRDGAEGLEFRRQGQGWPALGMLAPLSADEPRDPTITVELLPRE